MTRLNQSVHELAGDSGDACRKPSQQQSLQKQVLFRDSLVIRYDLIVNEFLLPDDIRTSALIYRLVHPRTPKFFGRPYLEFYRSVRNSAHRFGFLKVSNGEMETELFWGSWLDQPVSE